MSLSKNPIVRYGQFFHSEKLVLDSEPLTDHLHRHTCVAGGGRTSFRKTQNHLQVSIGEYIDLKLKLNTGT